MTHTGLTDTGDRSEVAHAQLCARERIEHPKPRRIGQRREDGGHSPHVPVVSRSVQSAYASNGITLLNPTAGFCII
jgi:hypothetical protein